MNYQVKRVLCVDLDWTIRRPLSTIKDPRGNDRIFIKDENDIELMPNVIDVLTQYRKDGWYVIGVTNQGGVAHGFKTIDNIEKEMYKTKDLLSYIGEDNKITCLMEGVMCCYKDAKGTVFPHNVRSLNRKPYIGMLAHIETTLYDNENIVVDWDNSLVVGDMESDKQLAFNADVPFQWAKDFFKW